MSEISDTSSRKLSAERIKDMQYEVTPLPDAVVPDDDDEEQQ